MTSVGSEVAVIQEFRARLIQSCASLLDRAQNAHVGIILSGGVDTGAVLAACKAAKDANKDLPRVSKAITVLASEDAPDRLFAERLAQEYGLEHLEIITSPNELLTGILDHTVQVTRSFDPMQVRNSLIIDKAIQAISEKYKDEVSLWLTGDAADELLGGYSFTWGLDDETWVKHRNDMCSTMYFTTDDIAKAHCLTVASPFRDTELVNWIMANCNKSLCVGNRALVAAVGDIPQDHLTGKTILRDAFTENSSFNRRKDPIEKGSGSTVLSTPGFFSQMLPSPREAQIREIALKHGIQLLDNNTEQVMYFSVFVQHFPSMDKVGIERGNGPGFCKACCFKLYKMDATFCRRCGMYPAQ